MGAKERGDGVRVCQRTGEADGAAQYLQQYYSGLARGMDCGNVEGSVPVSERLSRSGQLDGHIRRR